jgi:hypothetical protein
MSWILPFEPALDPPDYWCTSRCERRCEEHRNPDDVREDLDAAIAAAIAVFPSGYVPLKSEVREDIDTADWVRRRARPDSHGIAAGWRDSWSCYKTAAAVPDSGAFDAYVAACDNAVDTLRELVESERLHQIECDCDCSCHEV